MILFIRQPPGLIITVNPYISPLLRGQTYRTVVCTPSPRNVLNTHNERVNLIRLPGGRHLPRLGKATRNLFLIVARAACTPLAAASPVARSDMPLRGTHSPPAQFLSTFRDDTCKTKRDQKTQPYFSPKIEYRK